MTRTLTCIFAILGAACIAAEPARATDLGIEGSRFTIDGKPTFLLGMSYYGALGASENAIKSDLDDLQKNGFNWIRVWATWAGFDNNVSAVDEHGDPRSPYFDKLVWLVAECDRRGMIVDVTLSRGDGRNGSPNLPNLEAHRRAVEAITRALKEHKNWYLDLSNERNIGDARFTSIEDLKTLREVVREIDPDVLVTASQGGDIGDEELREYIHEAHVDFLCPHRPRGAGSAAETEARTRSYLADMKDAGRVVPVHYQEPFRRGYASWQPDVDDYLTDAQGARSGGAAGWCLHNGDQREGPDGRPRRSFDMSEHRLFDQLDEVELQAIRKLHDAFPGESPE